MKRDLASSSALEDLSARARQRDLTAEERRQLLVGLAASAEARLAHRAGAEFDAEDTVLPGDEALVERVLRRALSPPRARSRRGRQAWLVAAASLCVAAASFGAPWLAKRIKESPQPAPTSAVRSSSPGATAGASSARTQVPQASTNIAPPAAQAALPDSVARSPRPERVGPSTLPLRTTSPGAPFESVVVETAGQLYAEANRARRAGQTALAISRYDDLQRRFAGSPEAQSADMALGMLALGQGRASVALLHFGRVVSRGAGGGLLPEALWGQGQALAMLGQSDAARASYARILDEYPDSAYAAGARARLAASK